MAIRRYSLCAKEKHHANLICVLACTKHAPSACLHANQSGQPAVLQPRCVALCLACRFRFVASCQSARCACQAIEDRLRERFADDEQPSVNRSQINDICVFNSPMCPLIAGRAPRSGPLLANLKILVTSSLIPTTYDEPFFASYPLLMAILEPAPASGVSRVHEMSYGDAILETGRRLMANLELSSHAVLA